MRPPNPKIDPESPAARIAARFDRNGNPRASGLANAIGRTPSTVQRWLEKGAIPSDNHAEVVTAGRKIGVSLKPADFVDGRAFARPAPAEAAVA